MTASDNIMLTRIRDLVRAFDPDAEIILYGSRARGDARPDSDWDIIIVINRKISWDDEQKLRTVLYRFEVASDMVLSLVIHSQGEWNNPLFQLTPFYQNVIREGIKI